jgi:hypothetical protein
VSWFLLSYPTSRWSSFFNTRLSAFIRDLEFPVFLCYHSCPFIHFELKKSVWNLFAKFPKLLVRPSKDNCEIFYKRKFNFSCLKEKIVCFTARIRKGGEVTDESLINLGETSMDFICMFLLCRNFIEINSKKKRTFNRFKRWQRTPGKKVWKERRFFCN